MTSILKVLPAPVYSLLRKTYYFAVDTYDALSGSRDELTPPRSMIFIGNGDFKKTGEEFLRYFIEKAGLKPTDRVLDVGCGIGRMAAPLTKYLSKKGSYEGFDIVPHGISWCTKKITPLYPSFHFQLADVFNQYYHPAGKNKASEYKFPFENNSFDFIFLTSVFTHMLEQDMENYLSEISRVLKTGGKCLITFFLLNEDSISQIEKKQGVFSFKYLRGNSKVEDDNSPEAVVSYTEDFIKSLYEKNSLKIIVPIRYGSWCARKKYLSFQDIVIAQKS